MSKRCSTSVYVSIKGKRSKSLQEGAMWGGGQRHFDGKLFVEVGEYGNPLGDEEEKSLAELKEGYREDGHSVRVIKRCR